MPHQMSMGEDNILRVVFQGQMDREGAESYIDDYGRFVEQIPEGELLHFVVDASELGKISAAARKVLIESFRNPDPRVGSTAMIGASRYVRVLTGFVLKAVGRENIRLFPAEEEALAWLKEGD